LSELKDFWLKRKAAGPTTDLDLAVTREQAPSALHDFVSNGLAGYVPYEEAMSCQHATLFDSVLSPYLNIGCLN
jgi:deoxyribodipyrimidine photolyase-related protein